MKLGSFLFAEPTTRGQYAFVVLRLVIASFWLISDVPRWIALGEGHPLTNGIVRTLFGSSIVAFLTFLFTLLETLGAIALILGLATRLSRVASRGICDNRNLWCSYREHSVNS